MGCPVLVFGFDIAGGVGRFNYLTQHTVVFCLHNGIC